MKKEQKIKDSQFFEIQEKNQTQNNFEPKVRRNVQKILEEKAKTDEFFNFEDKIF